ncbi:LOW QUALITY PROTEIN: hypothetical protein U0070_003502, partial [Myodes glareolus]
SQSQDYKVIHCLPCSEQQLPATAPPYPQGFEELAHKPGFRCCVAFTLGEEMLCGVYNPTHILLWQGMSYYPPPPGRTEKPLHTVMHEQVMELERGHRRKPAAILTRMRVIIPTTASVPAVLTTVIEGSSTQQKRDQPRQDEGLQPESVAPNPGMLAALLKKTNLEHNGSFHGSITLVTFPGNLESKTELGCH